MGSTYAKHQDEDLHTGIHRNQMQLERILYQLKERGCRITRQRKMLLDIILNEECSSCKEIYYKASAIDDRIGSATVYRMINILEDIGAISRKNMYKVDDRYRTGESCVIEFQDSSRIELNENEWNDVVMKGLQSTGHEVHGDIRSVTMKACNDEGTGNGFK